MGWFFKAKAVVYLADIPIGMLQQRIGLAYQPLGNNIGFPVVSLKGTDSKIL